MATLKPQSNGLYSNTVIGGFGALAADGWTVTFGTARRGWAGWGLSGPLLAVPNVTAHPLTAGVGLPISYYLMWHYNCSKVLTNQSNKNWTKKFYIRSCDSFASDVLLLAP